MEKQASSKITQLIQTVVKTLGRKPGGAARTLWEEEANKWRRSQDTSDQLYNAAIKLGTILHQVNICAGLSLKGYRIRVDTLSSNIFNHGGVYQDPSVIGDDIKEDIPKLVLPTNTPFNASFGDKRWGRLIEFARGNEDVAGPVLSARSRYLSCGDGYI